MVAEVSVSVMVQWAVGWKRHMEQLAIINDVIEMQPDALPV